MKTQDITNGSIFTDRLPSHYKYYADSDGLFGWVWVWRGDLAGGCWLTKGRDVEHSGYSKDQVVDVLGYKQITPKQAEEYLNLGPFPRVAALPKTFSNGSKFKIINGCGDSYDFILIEIAPCEYTLLEVKYNYTISWTQTSKDRTPAGLAKFVIENGFKAVIYIDNNGNEIDITPKENDKPVVLRRVEFVYTNLKDETSWRTLDVHFEDDNYISGLDVDKNAVRRFNKSRIVGNKIIVVWE